MICLEEIIWTTFFLIFLSHFLDFTQLISAMIPQFCTLNLEVLSSLYYLCISLM